MGRCLVIFIPKTFILTKIKLVFRSSYLYILYFLTSVERKSFLSLSTSFPPLQREDEPIKLIIRLYVKSNVNEDALLLDSLFFLGIIIQ